MRLIHSKSSELRIERKGICLPVGIVYWTGILSLLFVFSLPIHAQFGASLSGTVLDPTGASIPQATVTLINPATQVTQISTSNETGAYHFNELAPGQYSLVVTAPGFKTNNVTDLPLAAETPRSVNVTLQPGGATESVQVNGDLVPAGDNKSATFTGRQSTVRRSSDCPLSAPTHMSWCALHPA